MKQFIKILLLMIMCTISWYGGALSQSNYTPLPEISYVEQTVVEQEPSIEELPEESPEEISEQKEEIVYVTQTGEKYHVYGCRYLKKSCIETNLSDAVHYYSPCARCHPPR